MSADARRLATAWIIVSWAALMVAVVLVRPLTPVDETRATAVAWDMRLSGDWLVLRLNGALYGHKPPLLMWLINIGWTTFGVSEWWPRVLTGLFGLGGLGLIAAIARRLEPDRTEFAALAAVITASSLGWMVFTGAVMYDLALAALVALAGYQILRAAAAERGAWIGVGIAIGLGILTKGPVALLHVLPLALLGPWWMSAKPPGQRNWAPWYRGVGLATLTGAAIALAWAVPTAVAAGEAFRREIFWSQSVDRMVSSPQHSAPLWYYAVLLPVLWLPWSVVPSVWQGLVVRARSERSMTVRFALAWLVPVFIGFSLFKTKLVYYMVPETAAFALLAAAGLVAGKDAARRLDAWCMAAGLAIIGAVLVAVPWAPRIAHLLSPDEYPLVAVSAGLILSAAALLVLWRARTRLTSALAIATASVAVAIALYAGIGRALLDGYDLHAVARELEQIQSAGHPIAHHGKYHGQFQFVGRLTRPLEVVQGPDALKLWAQRHPDGSVVVYSYRPLEHPTTTKPQAMQKFKGRFVYVWRAADLAGVSDGWARGRDDEE